LIFDCQVCNFIENYSFANSNSMNKKSTPELALELGALMTEMKNYLRQFIQFKIKENNINLTFEMLEVLACLWKQDGIKQQDIADITIKDKSSMTNLVDNLEKRNMIKRVADKEDRRNKLIFLTRQGKQLQQKLHPWVFEMYDKAATGINATDVNRSIVLIKKMNKNLRK
jgi:DNA-binding MarR family transcriptional regulator